MAITYPLAFPSWLKGMATSDFDIAMQVELAPIGGGDIARDLGPSLWSVNYKTPLLQAEPATEFGMWLNLLGNGIYTFYGWDFRRPYTKASPNGFSGLTRAGGGAFTGAVTITSVNSDNKTITLGGLPASYTLNPGDSIAWDYNTSVRAYHKFAETATSTSLGAIALEVRPWIRGGWTAGQAANIGQAAAKLHLVPNSKSFDGSPRGPGVWSFKAGQTLMQ